MKTTFQVALGIIIAGVVLGVGKLLFWRFFLKALTDDFEKKSTTAVAQLNKQQRQRQAEQYRIVTEVVKPKSLRECQAIYGNEINETTQTCMEGSVLTVRTNEKGHREIIKREKYYHLANQTAL